MLKIKDNIDLNTLKKYNFVEGNQTWDYWDGVRKIIIYKKDKRLTLNCPNIKVYDILFDLISNGLVEKTKYEVFRYNPTTKKDLLERIENLENKIKELENEKKKLL